MVVDVGNDGYGVRPTTKPMTAGTRPIA
jgi:hypothetical protein